MAAREISKTELVGMVVDMARDEGAKQTERLKAIEFLLEQGEQQSGSVQEVWDELFLVGEVRDD